MVFTRNLQSPVTDWTVIGTGATPLHSQTMGDVWKEIENQIWFLWLQAVRAGIATFPSTNLFSLRTLYTFNPVVFSLFDNNIGTRTIRSIIDDLRLAFGASVFAWTTTGPTNVTGALIDEVRRAVGLSPEEGALNLVAPEPAGAVVKELSPVSFRFNNTSAEAAGAPSKLISGGTRNIKRIIEFPESTRQSNVENFLLYRHGAGGAFTGDQTWSIALGDLDLSNAQDTYESDSTVFVSGDATSGSVVAEFNKITGYPTSGSGKVYLLAQMDSEAGAVDQANMFPILDSFPEVRLWQPALS